MAADMVKLLARGVDKVAIEERVTALAKRSLKRESKMAALKLAITMTDLTTLEGSDTPGKVQALCARALHPDLRDPSLPSVAAVCVYPNLVSTAAERLSASGVHIASVATGFPAGQTPLESRLEEVEQAVLDGADEIDMVVSRNALLRGDRETFCSEIKAVKEATGEAHLKVILETGELGSYETVRLAGLLACQSGADFIKTSTGKIPVAATLPVALVMLETVRDFEEVSGRQVGVKVAGGISTAKLALQYLVVAAETMGEGWLAPERFRFGASSLLNDLLFQIAKQETGAYQSEEYFAND